MSPQNGTALTLVYMCTVLQLCFCQFLSKNKSTLRLMVKEPVNGPNQWFSEAGCTDHKSCLRRVQ